jgi:hypothetical protein
MEPTSGLEPLILVRWHGPFGGAHPGARSACGLSGSQVEETFTGNSEEGYSNFATMA